MRGRSRRAGLRGEGWTRPRQGPCASRVRMRERSRLSGLRGEGRRSSRLRSRRGQGAHARQGPARGAGLLGGGAALSMASNIYVVRQRISRLGQRMSSFQLNLSPLKEPLGFIKVLEWIASIFAFATCGGFKGKTEIQVSCPKNPENRTITAAFGYPFRLNQAAFQAPPGVNVCDVEWRDHVLIGDYSSSAQFYVTFAVFVFLYCMAALLLYLGYTGLYRDSRKLTMTDFVVTLVATFLWLVSTSAWAKALTDIKIATGPNIVRELGPCNQRVTCHFGSVTSMGSLNVSVIFGFLNMILWGGNAWFVYKETSLHSPSNTSASHGQGGVPPPSGI
uniref:Synaptophysin like 1 n=1 Tax=Equus asinus TaxID=9793 RepID=A0A8C4MLD9_EQUAS